MALRIGSLFVSIGASTAELDKGIGKALKKIDQFSSQVEKITKKATQLSLAVTGPIVAAIALAAKYNKQVAAEVDKVKGAFAALASEVASAFLPVVRQAADTILRVVTWLREMDPATKATIVSWATMAAKIGAVALAVGQVANVVGIVAKLGSLALTLAPAVPVLLAIAAAVAGIIALTGALSIAWDAWGTGISAMLNGVKGFFVSAFQTIMNAVGGALKFLRDSVVSILKTIKSALLSLPGTLGQGLIDNIDTALYAMTDSGAIPQLFGDMADTAASYGKDAGKGFGESFKRGLKATGIDNLIGMVEGLMKGPSGGPVKGLGSTLADQAKDRKHLDDLAKKRAKEQAEAAERAAQALRDLHNSARDAALALVQGLAGKTGRAGGIFAAGVTGTSQGASLGALAGPKGAAVGAAAGFAVGAFTELVASSEGFKKTIESVDAIVGSVAELYGSLVSAFQPMILVVGMLVNAALRPFLASSKALADQIVKLAPVLVPLVQRVGVVADLLMRFVFTTRRTAAALMVWEKVGRGLFDAVKFSGTSMLNAALAIVDFWNGLIGSFRDILRNVAGMDVAGAKPFAFLDKFADTLNSLTLSGTRGAIADALATLSGASYDAAAAQIANAAAQQEQTEAIERSLGAWLNVPEGYKVAEARFAAMNPEGGNVSGALGAVTGTLVAPTLNVTIVSNDPAVIWSKLQPLIKWDNFKRTGSTEGGS